MPDLDTKFFTRNKAWDGLGTEVKDSPNSLQALKMAGLDWDVVQHNVIVDGTPIEGYKANIRDSDNQFLGIVSYRYKIVQNRDAFEFTDAIIGNADIEVKYETAGSLQSGKRVWLVAKMPNVDVLGDKVEPFIVFTNSHDGTGAIKVAMTPVRIICQNMITMAIKRAERTWSTKHIGDLTSKLHEAEITLNTAKRYVDNMNETADLLSQKTIGIRSLNQMLEELFPIPQKGGKITDRRVANAERFRNIFLELYNNSSDLKRFRGNGWGFYNAVADLVSHFEPARRTTNYDENRFMNLVDGNALLEDTQNLIMRI